MNAHINVECCNYAMAIKYICKYINKGSDQVTFSVNTQSRDEIERFISGRYISSSEATWRIFGFHIHNHYPPVTPLEVHLENRQRIYFTPENAIHLITNPRDTTLLGFSKPCQEDEFARTLLYIEVPSYFTWSKTDYKFKKRTNRGGIPVPDFPSYYKAHALGRIHSVHPKMVDCFHLRMLLHHVRGPTSFESLRTVNGIVYETYQGACKALNLLDDDHHWDETLQEARDYRSAQKLRELFAIILVFGPPSDPSVLWNKYREDFSEDFEYQYRSRTGQPAPIGVIENEALADIQKRVQEIGGGKLSEYGLPEVVYETVQEEHNILEMAHFVAENEHLSNEDQRAIYEEIIRYVDENQGVTMFLDAPGGTGKTFLIKLLLNKVLLR